MYRLPTTSSAPSGASQEREQRVTGGPNRASGLRGSRTDRKEKVMNGYLGRDKVWTPDIWTNIDKAVPAEAGQVRVAQKVFPTTSMPNAQSVPADIFNPNTMTIQEGATIPLVELSI